MKIQDITPLDIKFTSINNDINGNPRYVCHFLAFKPRQNEDEPYKLFTYDEGLAISRQLGGKKYHTKSYGGGIVFSTYNLPNLKANILLLTGEGVRYTTKIGNRVEKRVFMRSDVTNNKGKLKKWFKLINYSGDVLKYSLDKS